MALCVACRLGLPGQATDCPVCEARGIGSELIITKVELVSALKTRETGWSRAPEVPPRRGASRVRTVLATTGLALGITAILMMLASLVDGLWN